MLIKGATEENRYRISRPADDYQVKGVRTWPDGSRYEGEFLDGHFHGEGTFTWPDGSAYKGQWLNDFPHGQGIFTWPDGTQYKAEWEEGRSRTEMSRLKSAEEEKKKKK